MAQSAGSSPLSGSTSIDLGLGNALSAQTKSETEEERKRRLLGIQQNGVSPAVQSLFGLTGT